MTVTLLKGSLIRLNATDLSEHNRQALQDDLEGLKTDNRTVNGTMRRYYVGSKRKFSFNWEMLPALDAQTVDGKAGRNTLKSFYDSNMGTTVTLTYKEVDGSNQQVDVAVTCFIDSYTESLEKRFDRQMWNVSITLIEQ